MFTLHTSNTRSRIASLVEIHRLLTLCCYVVLASPSSQYSTVSSSAMAFCAAWFICSWDRKRSQTIGLMIRYDMIWYNSYNWNQLNIIWFVLGYNLQHHLVSCMRMCSVYAHWLKYTYILHYTVYYIPCQTQLAESWLYSVSPCHTDSAEQSRARLLISSQILIENLTFGTNNSHMYLYLFWCWQKRWPEH